MIVAVTSARNYLLCLSIKYNGHMYSPTCIFVTKTLTALRYRIHYLFLTERAIEDGRRFL
jgi:hypothetical protein